MEHRIIVRGCRIEVPGRGLRSCRGVASLLISAAALAPSSVFALLGGFDFPVPRRSTTRGDELIAACAACGESKVTFIVFTLGAPEMPKSPSLDGFN